MWNRIFKNTRRTLAPGGLVSAVTKPPDEIKILDGFRNIMFRFKLPYVTTLRGLVNCATFQAVCGMNYRHFWS
jgi:hypothetical protein